MRVGCVKVRAERRADAVALCDSEFDRDGIMGLAMLIAGLPQPHHVRATAPTVQCLSNGRCASDLRGECTVGAELSRKTVTQPGKS